MRTRAVMNPSVLLFPYETGMHYEDADTAVYSLHGKTRLSFVRGTYYVYVSRGYAIFSETFYIAPGCFGAFTAGRIDTTAAAEVMVVQAKNFRGMFHYGGPIEKEGRLRYIDGCTDTGLIAPIKRGDPCLHHLHFPERTTQTPHTHPDIRVGCVAEGHGDCVTPFGIEPLLEGTQFVIFPENGKTYTGTDGQQHKAGEHSFRTAGSHMDVVAWHPTSEVGPTDEHHQMLAQTKLVA